MGITVNLNMNQGIRMKDTFIVVMLGEKAPGNIIKQNAKSEYV
jgi:hypothetical protein